MHAIIRDDTPEPVSGPFKDAAGVSHSASVLTLWSQAELAAIGVYPIIETQIPAGTVSTGSTLIWDGETVTRVYTSEPAPPPTVPVLIAAVDEHVEATAQSMEYKSAAHCAGYVSSTVPQWAAEAAAFVAWRDAVWVTAYQMDPDAPPESVAAALALLPEWVRPAV
jgi:hypothetical protein